MPFKVEALQKVYQLDLFGGVPVAPVTKLGAMHYVLCCPLCGCLHEVGPSVLHGSTTTPRCVVKPPHPITVANWRKAHPETANYREIVLKLREFDEVVISIPAPERMAA